jgi:hypothetical protein
MMNLPCLYIYMNLCLNQTKLTTILLAVALPRVLGECEDAGQIVGALECVLLYFRRCSLLFQNVFSYILEGVLFFFRRCCRTPSSGAGGVWGCRRDCSCSWFSLVWLTPDCSCSPSSIVVSLVWYRHKLPYPFLWCWGSVRMQARL